MLERHQNIYNFQGVHWLRTKKALAEVMPRTDVGHFYLNCCGRLSVTALMNLRSWKYFSSSVFLQRTYINGPLAWCWGKFSLGFTCNTQQSGQAEQESGLSVRSRALRDALLYQW